RILEEAEKEFAQKGFIGANINKISKNAGISIGSMYSYFESKEDLYLEVLQRGIDLIFQVIDRLSVEEYDFFEYLRALLKKTREYAIKYPNLNQIYIDLASYQTEKLARRLSYSIESITKKLYINLVKKGKEDGIIGEYLKDGILHYYIDNLIMSYQFSFTSSYWKNRMDILLGDEFRDYEEVENELVEIIKNGLAINIINTSKNK
ncbi:TetR/AcrR family transcriptional regulator, partial [Romboutsia sp.]|uniref:TetR/AcrR family transcriptional regulator n=1 Tax=Romboutsia sp. TaxID=1965302 RepID=UPI003F3AE71E